MLDNWYKIAGIAVAVVIMIATVVGPSVGGIFWLARLDSDVKRLQTDVERLQTDVEQLQSDMSGVREDIADVKADMRLVLSKLDDRAEAVTQSPAAEPSGRVVDP